MSLPSFFQYLITHPMLQYGLVMILVILTGLVIITAPKKSAKKSLPTSSARVIQSMVPSNKDFSAIAGEDVVTTQLDLAKAYIEMGKKDQAKRILRNTLTSGNPAQQTAARQLLESVTA